MIQYGIKISHYILIYTMLLSREEKTRLLARFPSLELSYENVLHRKVQADVYMLIPDGQKSFVWFSYWQDKNVCFVILLNRVQYYKTLFVRFPDIKNNLKNFPC